jgi:putative aldouronate transport system permease protein
MKSFFQQIPVSLEESALIDGTNEIQALFWIILPLSLPSLATIGLFYAVGHWNGFFSALIYLKDKELFPLQIILRQIVIQNQTDDMLSDLNQGRELISESIKFATIIVATLPILIIYPFIQKYFVKGVMVGAVKG